ncbi:primase-helicase zinc-binding domain-containing protein [Shewanella goraebulensis]|uniref:primase-helicase zinc-binding domain-containing protein n=1 Tax=Shewanella goraebulensis TaxID=3050637 RepID=UPI00254E542D|nr:primase-helicase zinc-binding domain-containing protein [Shewanella goraebulensis]
MSGYIKNVVNSANGQWRSILLNLGIYVPHSGKHGPCPICGGQDRFHFDNKLEEGTWHCRQCEGRVAGDGLDLVSKFNGIPLYESARKVAQILRIDTSLPTTTEINSYSRNDIMTRDNEASKLRKRRIAAANQATAIWENSIPADPEHIYLRLKGIYPNGARQLITTVKNGKASFPPNTLVLPVRDYKHNLISLEFIHLRTKQGLAGGLRKGGQLILGDLTSAKHIWIAEGFATGATIHQLSGEPVIIAFTANNLSTVALSAQYEFHEATLSIAGDDDPAGRKYAEMAAMLTNSRMKIPSFSTEEMLKLNYSGKKMYTDWNDYCALYGDKFTLQALYL